MPVRTVIERGPKGKRAVALSLDWIGWNRGAKSAEVALETMEAYRARYRPVTELAGMAAAFDEAGPIEVVEDRVGTGSVDFWGISFSASSTEHEALAPDDIERRITLLRACWAFFDGVAGSVSATMQKGPRGGGRERDEIIRHVRRVEILDFAGSLGLVVPDDYELISANLADLREQYVALMRAYNAGEVTKRMRSRTLPFLIRHTAFHTLDHAWEMQDKDLGAA